ncbi:calcium/proton exchanger [Longimicrobium terrae]|uniref:Ca(2+)/H(+) antiporter n=1 Tax=Longimicrobium terrae TaxID=1639882 RepID=A0A841GZ25_9BACT|nr:calcium/proton exchanger [Longimicrobium terrae]MBB4636464.1 Ca2+:H+ antiporter [Longimicrobium terrae]MBB6071012.1 Ca2+:H+ antiporter [Longimicrobium terrae]
MATTASKPGLFTAANVMNLLLVFVPVAMLMEWVFHSSPAAIFVVACLGIIPLAGQMGHATEEIAERVGEGVGGLLNATFGNAAELIIAIVALRAGLFDLVKASITGSIIGNVLLVFGLSALAGGLKYETQRFNRTAASLGSTLLVLSGVGLVVPAIFHMLVGATAPGAERNLSTEIAVVLMVTYILSLVFTLKTHRHLYMGDAGTDAEVAHGPAKPMGRSIGKLVLATIGVAVMAEFLVGAATETAEALGWSEVFVGVIVVAIIGNAAEHSTAIIMAMKNKMDAAINIAVGSSIQVALFVAPLLVFLSYVIAPQPMDLIFTPLEVLAVGLCVGIMAFCSNDGESHWMEGVQLLAVYVILGIAFYFLPAAATAGAH